MGPLTHKNKCGIFIGVWANTRNIEWPLILSQFIVFDLIVMRYTYLLITTGLLCEWASLGSWVHKMKLQQHDFEHWRLSNIYKLKVLILHKSTACIQFQNLDSQDCLISLSIVYFVSKHWKMLQGLCLVQFAVYFFRSFQRLLVRVFMAFSL